MSRSLSSFAQDFRPEPPSNIDPDHLNYRTKKALASLHIIANTLQHDTRNSHNRFMKENWLKIWPWLVSLCRCVLDRPPPTTVEGVAVAFRIVENAPVLFTYPLYPPNFNDFHLLLKPILDSSPQVLALALELWLYGCTVEHSSLNDLTSAIGLLLEAHCARNGPAEKLPPGPVTEAFERVIKNTERWDIPEICVKAMIHEITKPDLICHTLRNILNVLSTLARIPSIHPKLMQRDGISWAARILAKLSSRKTYWLGRGAEFDDVAKCFLEALQFLLYSLYYDRYNLTKALDEGFLVTIFKSREIFIEDSRRRDPDNIHSLANRMTFVLIQLTPALIHRPVLVRTVRNLKKVEKLKKQLAIVDSDPFKAGYCGSLHDAWRKLKAETSRRNAIMNKIDPWPGQYTLRICGYRQCPRAHVLDTTHPFLRCSGCKSEVYCSEECHRDAWLITSSHSITCKHRRHLLGKGDSREPSSLEHATIRKQVSFDVSFPSSPYSSKINQLKNQYRLKHPEDKRILVWMDYSNHPIEMEVVTLAEAEKRIQILAKQHGNKINRLGERAAAVAKIPWRFGNSQPMLAMHYD
ncbi:hypothetical protein V5O48_014996 [Marasmius crinis-equi]|uniref:MYND-type domain-containing protein n=1 Tax=Marasmius crinis-equi TaxID=585013 RepID=A0ABR3EVT2_9AGAR